MDVNTNSIRITLAHKEAADLISVLEYALHCYDYDRKKNIAMNLLTEDQYFLAANMIDQIRGASNV